MTLLTQQELMVPPPARRLQVSPGCTSWWGVDASVRAVSIAYVTSDGSRGVRTASFPDLSGGARLAAIWRETRVLALEVAELAIPGLVFVEQPSGARPNPALSYAVGVVIAAIHDAVAPMRLETPTSAWWKKRACGRGNIYKPKRGEPEYGVVTWARLNGYDGSSWDEADAWAIAEAARREVALEPR